MNVWAWALAITMGIMNIAFNLQAQRTATDAQSWAEGVVSLQFAVLFAIGCASLLVLYTLYCQKVPLATAVLFMGATSIVGGTLFGVLFRGNRLDLPEWSLITLIGMLFLYRLLRSLLSAS
jgi:multidrug transporter EmrE-like cation transporter